MTTTLDIQTQQFTDVSAWLTQLQEQNAAWQAIGWEFLETLRDGINQFGRSNDSALMELYDLASQATGIGIKRLQNLVSMARNEVSQIAQDYELDFGYAEAVLGLSADEADDILSKAKAHAKTVGQVRKEAWGVKNTAPAGGNSSDDEPPFCNELHYAADPLPDAYDMDAFIAIPREPVAAARMLLREFDAGQIAALVAELVR
jgi:hypothetical protein